MLVAVLHAALQAVVGVFGGMVSRLIAGDLDMAYPLVVNDAGIIEPQPIDPTETFVNSDDSGLSETSILDYWVWAFSDLVGNTERGVLAE